MPIHANSINKGFWSAKYGEDQVNQILAKMMLIDTEVSEMADAYVKQRGEDEIKSEVADILIRLLDLFEALGGFLQFYQILHVCFRFYPKSFSK